MTRRIQCGGTILEIDPLTGELTLEDFLNEPPPAHMVPMQTPKVELGSSFGVFGIPFLDNLLGTSTASWTSSSRTWRSSLRRSRRRRRS